MTSAVIANIIAAIAIAGTVIGFAYSVKNDVAVLQTAVNIKFEYVTKDIAELKDYILPRHPQPPKP
jgi:hypothetical protein